MQIGIAEGLSAFIGLFDLKDIIPIPALMLATTMIAILILWIGTAKMKRMACPE